MAIKENEIFDMDNFIKRHFLIALEDLGASIRDYNYDLFCYALLCAIAGIDMILIAKRYKL